VKLAIVAALAACTHSGTPDLPVDPGGGGGAGGGGGGGGSDAAVDTSNQLAGRVCLAPDPRDLATCAATGAGGITVTLGTQTASTLGDGTFTMLIPQGSALVWHASGTTIVTSVMPAGARAEIPVLAQTTYNDLANGNGVVLAADQGAVMARVVHAGAPLAGARANASPASLQYGAFYDGTSSTVWLQSATGTHGAAWLPGLAAPGNAAVSITPSGGSATAIGTLPIEAGAITFVVADIP